MFNYVKLIDQLIVKSKLDMIENTLKKVSNYIIKIKVKLLIYRICKIIKI